jgi:Cd2+/Zn2+-exporting ATPase
MRKLSLPENAMSTPETNKKVPQFSALKLNPLPQKTIAAEGSCTTQPEQTLPDNGTRYSWVVNGMDCAACARKVENAVRQVKGVDHVQVLFATEKLLVSAASDISAQVEAAVKAPDIPCAAKMPRPKKSARCARIFR